MIVDSIHDAIRKAIEDGTMKGFRTKKEAMEAGSLFGWRNKAIKILGRFQNSWVVGSEDFEPTYIAGLPHSNYRFPLLRWDNRPDGIKFCPVLQLQAIQKEMNK